MHRYIAEVVPGLETIARSEIENKLPSIQIYKTRDGEIDFAYSESENKLEGLSTVISIYRLVEFSVPRPKALLGHEHFTRLISELKEIKNNANFQNWHLAAAGTHTPVMQRIIQEISGKLSLEHDANEGDLLLRLRPHRQNDITVWQALIRLTPRPLATRNWRVVNMPGALNASVAAAILHFTRQKNDDIFLNIGCGSGTMLIERATSLSAKLIIGIDKSSEAIDASIMNLEASSQKDVVLIKGDAQTLPLGDHSVDQIVADLPFGQHIGSHEENEWLYPALLHEAGRVAKQGASFIVITHEVKLLESCLTALPQWNLQSQTMINLTGLHPRIYVLERI